MGRAPGSSMRGEQDHETAGAGHTTARRAPLDCRAARQRGALWRLQRLVDMTHFCWHAAYDAFQRALPARREREAWLAQERYGPAIAQRIMALGHIQGQAER
jgi:hypothetical protein